MLHSKSHSPILNESQTIPSWEPYTGDYSLEEGHIHVWKIDLDQITSSHSLFTNLSHDEYMRADRLIGENKRRLFSAGRLALREILSRYTCVSAKKMKFLYSHHGKPSIDPSISNHPVQFNLSHSGNKMLLALSHALPVGIDIEKIDPISVKDWIARQNFSSYDSDYFLHLQSGQRTSAFYQLWTL